MKALLTRWVGMAMCLIAAQAQAKIECAALFNREGHADTYYVLALIDPSDAKTPARREQDRERLASTFTPQLNTLARRMHDGASSRRLRLELVVCEHLVRSVDLARDEVRELAGAKVVAVLWKGQEGDKPVLINLAVPIFLRSSGAIRQDAEVATLYVSKAMNTVDGWIETLTQNSGELYRPFVSMGLASVYQRLNELTPAWRGYCDSRSSLATLAHSALRPPREMLEADIATPLAQAMKELELSSKQLNRPPLPGC